MQYLALICHSTRFPCMNNYLKKIIGTNLGPEEEADFQELSASSNKDMETLISQMQTTRI